MNYYVSSLSYFTSSSYSLYYPSAIEHLCNYNTKYLIIPQNVNIVAEISVLLHTLSEHLNSKNMKITQKAIQVTMSTLIMILS